MNLFLKVTAIFEAITGIGLILIPKVIVQLLFSAALNDIAGIMIAMIAGAALASIAFYCWSVSRDSKSYPLIKILLFYNLAVIAIAMYGLINFPIYGIGIIGAIGFHSILAVWSLFILRNN